MYWEYQNLFFSRLAMNTKEFYVLEGSFLAMNTKE